MNTKKIITSLLIVSLAVLSFVAATSSYFSDTEESINNVFAAGEIDLKIDNSSYYDFLSCQDVGDNDYRWQNPGDHNFTDSYLKNLIGTECTTSWKSTDLDGQLFFDFKDLKPGDWGEDTVSLYVDNNDSYVCMDINLTSTDENDLSEPESLIDTTDGEDGGELQNYLKFIWWADDGDNVLEDTEVSNIFAQNVGLEELNNVALADSQNNVWGQDGPFPGGNDPEEYTKYIAKAWCFGEITTKPVENGADEHFPYDDPGIRCNGSLDDLNIAQTDGVTADLKFTAVQARGNEGFLCAGCSEQGSGWAGTVYSANQGTLKNGNPITDTTRTDPTNALGANDNQFFSLGFGGSIILELQGYITGTGISSFELTNGRSTYPEERADIYVGENPTGPWYLVGTASSKDNATGVSTFDVSGLGLDYIQFIKIVDATNKAINSSTADAFDLDAVGAVVCLDNVE